VVTIAIEANGPVDDVRRIMTAFMNDALARGMQPAFDDPTPIMQTGSGRFVVDVPQAKSDEEGRSIVTAYLDQTPEANDVLTIVSE